MTRAEIKEKLYDMLYELSRSGVGGPVIHAARAKRFTDAIYALFDEQDKPTERGIGSRRNRIETSLEIFEKISPLKVKSQDPLSSIVVRKECDMCELWRQLPCNRPQCKNGTITRPATEDEVAEGLKSMLKCHEYKDGWPLRGIGRLEVADEQEEKGR